MHPYGHHHCSQGRRFGARSPIRQAGVGADRALRLRSGLPPAGPGRPRAACRQCPTAPHRIGGDCPGRADGKALEPVAPARGAASDGPGSHGSAEGGPVTAIERVRRARAALLGALTASALLLAAAAFALVLGLAVLLDAATPASLPIRKAVVPLDRKSVV